MIHKSLSLNGAWEMAYSPDRYDGTGNPFDIKGKFTSGTVIENAVPGFWEDMTESFLYADFFKDLKINPEWELYAFPESTTQREDGIRIVGNCECEELKNMPHDGFCGWQFGEMLEKGNAVCFESELVPFNPIIELVSTHKNVIRQSALFEFEAMGGKLLVCSLKLDSGDPGAKWFRNEIISYAKSEEFAPNDYVDEEAFDSLVNTLSKKSITNKNFAFNANDKTSTRRKKN